MPKKAAHDDDGGGWTKVPEMKSVAHKKRMEEKAAAEKLAAEMEKHQQMGANYGAIDKTKKKAAPEPVKVEEKKVEKTAVEKKAIRKKEKAKAAEKRAKTEGKASPKASSPVAPMMFKDICKSGDMEKTISEIKALPAKYPGRAKDQFLTAVAFLDARFPPECFISDKYKSVQLKDRFACPLKDVGSDDIPSLIQKIVDQSGDNMMWNSALKDLIFNSFGRDGGRPDGGTHYLGSKLAIQILLRHRPEAFCANYKSVEDMFHSGSTINDNAALNYAWVLGQLTDRGAITGIKSWNRVFYSKMTAADAKGAAVDAGYCAGEHLGSLNAPVKERKEFRSDHNNKDPISAEQLCLFLGHLSAKSKRSRRLFDSLVLNYSINFTPFSGRTYFTKLAALLRTEKNNRDLVLDLLTSCICNDSGPHGALYCWTNDLLPIVRESCSILEHLNKNQKVLATKLNGKEMEKLLTRISDQCADINSGKLAPEGKKAKSCDYTKDDVSKLMSLCKKASGLANAVPLEAPKTTANVKQVKEAMAKKKASGGFCSTLFSLFSFIIIISLLVYIALPFVPAEQRVEIDKFTSTVSEKMSPHIEAAMVHAKPLIDAATPHYNSAKAALGSLAK
eukprot:TRINITY_DN135_c1_g1_i1.p1 TRINITY_DN135_c1_g1~~TRINITY_DN135_c1_g1_i1.p1  ORF type:complete len:633 (+),score=173.42 TRINITY_DN135_c1_g1_i1:47-1900(+)